MKESKIAGSSLDAWVEGYFDKFLKVPTDPGLDNSSGCLPS